MEINVQRVYELTGAPKNNSALVDRLWPRGIAKEDLSGAPWLKELTPSNELRTWFHEDTENRFEIFSEKYMEELKDKKDAAKTILADFTEEITLLTAVKDVERSHIPTLKTFLTNL